MVSPRTKGFLLYLTLLAVITLFLAFIQAGAAQQGERLSVEILLVGLLAASYALFYAVDWMVKRRIDEREDPAT